MAKEFQEEPSDELKQFESLLRGCPPAAMQIDRDRLMYLAGQASVTSEVTPPATTRQSARGFASYKSLAWPLATAALLLLSLTLSAAILFRASEVRIVYVAQPASGGSTELVVLPATESPQPTAVNDVPNYLHIRNLVLARGVEALPEPTVAVSHRPHKPAETNFISPLLRHDF